MDHELGALINERGQVAAQLELVEGAARSSAEAQAVATLESTLQDLRGLASGCDPGGAARARAAVRGAW